MDKELRQILNQMQSSREQDITRVQILLSKAPKEVVALLIAVVAEVKANPEPTIKFVGTLAELALAEIIPGAWERRHESPEEEQKP